jgi:hypothetical protein
MLSLGMLYIPTSTTSAEDVETHGLRVRRDQLSLRSKIVLGIGAALLQDL